MRLLVLLCLTLGACDRAPEVPTSAENRDLDEAGRMLDNADSNLATVDPGNFQSPDPETSK